MTCHDCHHRHDISWASAFAWALKVSVWLLIAYIGAGLLVMGTARVCLDDPARCADLAK